MRERENDMKGRANTSQCKFISDKWRGTEREREREREKEDVNCANATMSAAQA